MSHSTVISKTHIGSQVPMDQARLPIVRRLVERIEQDANGCWIWQGSRSALGYGHVTVQGKVWTTHRLTYELFRGPVPDEMQACHICDVPACCNPDHIFLGTAKDNALDSKAKRRHYTSSKTHCVRGHAYAVFGAIRSDGRRKCLKCERDRWVREKKGTGPANKVKTHCIRGHEFAGANLYVKPNGERQCRTCRREVVKRIQRERTSSSAVSSP